MGLAPIPPPSVPMAEPAAQALAPQQQQQVVNLTQEQVLKAWKGELERFLRDEIISTIDTEKAYQYLEIRRNHLTLKGRQNLLLHPTASGLDFRPMTSGGENVASITTSGGYDYDMRIYQGEIRKFVAVLGQRPPNIRYSLLPGFRDFAQRRRELAQKLAEAWHYAINVKKIYRRMVLAEATDGTVFIHTPFVTSAEKYGTTGVPRYTYREEQISPDLYKCQNELCLTETTEEMLDPAGNCPECAGPMNREQGVTIQVAEYAGEERYANGCVECHIRTGLHITTPFNCEDIYRVPWLRDEGELGKAAMISAYPELADRADMAGGWADPTGGQQAREQVASYSGLRSAWKHTNWLHSKFWVTPAMFNLFKNKELQAYARTAWPNGVRITCANTEAIRTAPERLTDVWVDVQPDEAPTMWAQPYFDSVIQYGEAINTLYNIMIEMAERSIPLIFMDPSLMDIDQHNKRPRRVGEVVLARAGAGSFQHRISKFEPSKLEPGFTNLIEFATEYMHQNDGMLPQVFGGGDKAQTAKEATMRLRQALMSLSTIHQNNGEGLARATHNAVRQFAMHSDGVVHMPNSDDYIDLGDISELLQGGVRAEPEEAIPMTAGERRDYIIDIAATNPELAQRIGVFAATNLDDINEAMGMTDWEVPGVAARSMLMEIIEQLAMGQPVEQLGDFDPLTGQQMPPTMGPSIPADPAMFAPEFALEVTRDYIYSPEGKMLNQQNPIGFQNILLFLRAWYQLTPPEMGGPPLPPAPPPGAAPGEEESDDAGPAPAGPVPAEEPAPAGSNMIQ